METQHAKHDVRVHIDQHLYQSPDPTTGASLYTLGHVHEECELFREVDGNREDEPVPRDEVPLHLKQDEHFHSAKAHERVFKIVVNGEHMEVKKKILTFTEVTQLAFPNSPTKPNVVFTVTYKKAVAPRHEGSLVEGGKVEIKNGTIFNVTRTDKS